MRDLCIQVRYALEGAEHFLDETTGVLSEAVDLTNARKCIEELLMTFEEQSNAQELGDRMARDGMATQRELQVKLRKEHMEPVAAIARLDLRDRPEFVAFQMPTAAVRAWQLIMYARAMADAAAAYKNVFLKRGLPSTFLDGFDRAIATLEESVSDREHNLMGRLHATRQLKRAASDGRVVLRVLDALVRQAAGDNESLLRGWQAARLIRPRSVNSTTVE